MPAAPLTVQPSSSGRAGSGRGRSRSARSRRAGRHARRARRCADPSGSSGGWPDPAGRGPSSRRPRCSDRRRGSGSGPEKFLNEQIWPFFSATRIEPSGANSMLRRRGQPRHHHAVGKAGRQSGVRVLGALNEADQNRGSEQDECHRTADETGADWTPGDAAIAVYPQVVADARAPSRCVLP